MTSHFGTFCSKSKYRVSFKILGMMNSRLGQVDGFGKNEVELTPKSELVPGTQVLG